MKLFTLIHVQRHEKESTDRETRTLKDRLLPYLLCAIQLHKSLKQTDTSLSVITNDKEYLRQLTGLAQILDFIELDFALMVPEDVKFYSAHYKIETYQYLATLREEYVGMIDCDITCINQINSAFQNIIDQKLPLYYDITDQMVPAFGLDRIIKDKEKISGKPSIGLWAGGEFFSGTPAFFSELCNAIDLVKENYFKNYKSLFHEGDEMLTSVAIESMLAAGKPIYNAGNLGVITRYWSINTRHYQKSFNAYKEYFLLHLPSDKEFLSRVAQNKEVNNILPLYIKYLWKMKPRQIASKIFRYLKSK